MGFSTSAPNGKFWCELWTVVFVEWIYFHAWCNFSGFKTSSRDCHLINVLALQLNLCSVLTTQNTVLFIALFIIFNQFSIKTFFPYTQQNATFLYVATFRHIIVDPNFGVDKSSFSRWEQEILPSFEKFVPNLRALPSFYLHFMIFSSAVRIMSSPFRRPPKLFLLCLIFNVINPTTSSNVTSDLVCFDKHEFCPFWAEEKQLCQSTCQLMTMRDACVASCGYCEQADSAEDSQRYFCRAQVAGASPSTLYF